MNNQVFGVRQVGCCLQIVPLPTPTPPPPPCIDEECLCVQQLQNLLKMIIILIF